MRYYPVFLDLQGRPVVALGGGPAMERRARGLLAAGASLTVIAEDLTPGLEALVESGALRHRRRGYRRGDLEGATLVVGERRADGSHREVFEEAEERAIPVSIEDDPQHSSFISAAVVQRGDLTLAISTSGKAPALAVRLREALERRLGPEYERFLEIAGRLRCPLAESVPDLATRKARWYELVDSDVLALLARGDDERAERRIFEILGVTPEEALERAEPRELAQVEP